VRMGKEVTIEGITNKAAGAAIFSPFWLPSLEEAHAVAAFLLAVFGILWFAV
jgi:hypothetical protein